jgi:hypothetical protein
VFAGIGFFSYSPQKLRWGPHNVLCAFDQSQRQIRLADAAGPLQAFGRARAVNRTPDRPLDVDMLFDAALPIAVDDVAVWTRPSLLLATAASDGVMLMSSFDLVKLWPQLWPNTRAADRTLQAGVPTLPGFRAVEYRLEGPKMKTRVAHIDPTIIFDPEEWLTARLGRLVPL